MAIKSILLKNKYLQQDYNYYLSQEIFLSRKRYFVFAFLFIWHCIFRIRKAVFKTPVYKTTKKQESGIINREKIDSFVARLEKYDVISFDVFDTLVLRPFENPTDCFSLLEYNNKLFWFKNYREFSERIAREKTEKPNREINIFDVYSELSNYYGFVDINKKAEEEIDLESSICYANPYLQEVYRKLVDHGKRIIAVSDMYIPERYIKQILNKCGYDISDVFISCDYGVSKRTGELQKVIQKKIGPDKSIIHIDDNGYCIKGCKTAGWHAFHYYRCSRIGYPYRMREINTPVSQMYKGIINNYLHCGLNKLNPQEEIGFVYAGIAVCGFDEWLTTLCKNNNYDKILFLSRDMDAFYKAYNQYYKDIPCEYIQSSRNALHQLYFEQCPEEFLRISLDARVDLNKTVGCVLEEVDLDFLKTEATQAGINLEEYFTSNNIKILKAFIYKNKSKIIKKFESCNNAVKQYFIKKINGAKRICVTGLGWAGTEIIIIKWLVEEKWKLQVKVFGALFGADTNVGIIDNIIANNISIFAFGEIINRNLSFATIKNKYSFLLALEHIFTSSECSLIKYQVGKDGNISFITKEKNPNALLINDIHRGISIFINEFLKHRKPFLSALPISSIDAYEPLFNILNNKKYVLLTLGDFVERPRAISGWDNDNDYIKLKEILF